MDFFDYELPAELIAQRPAPQRDQSRLMVLASDPALLQHHYFRDLPNILQPGDLLVLNDTKVLPARLFGRRQRTGAKWEGLFLAAAGDGHWELLAQTCGTPQEGEIVEIEPGPLRLQLSGRSPEESLRLGWAHGALLTTFPGDVTMARLHEVEALAKGGSARVQR